MQTKTQRSKSLKDWYITRSTQSEIYYILYSDQILLANMSHFQIESSLLLFLTVVVLGVLPGMLKLWTSCLRKNTNKGQCWHVFVFCNVHPATISYQPVRSAWSYIRLIGQSHDFSRAYSLFVARVASFAPSAKRKGANDATRDTNKLHDRQKSCDYHYYQYTRPNRTNSFNKKKMFNRDETMVGKLLLQYDQLNKSQIKFLFVYKKSFPSSCW